MRVAFTIAGAQKSGTTALRAALHDHPQLCFHAQKEAHFFDTRSFFDGDGPVDYGAYHRLFPAPAPDQLLGDKTPSYLFFEAVPQRIRDYNPRMKIVILLRNPVERAHSHYWMLRRNRGITETFLERVSCEEALASRSQAPQRGQSVLARGFYSAQLERFRALFPPDQIFVARYDEFAADNRATATAVCRFLGVDPARLTAPNAELAPRTRAYPPMTPCERQRLAAIYAPEVERLQALLGWNCGDWLADTGESPR